LQNFKFPQLNANIDFVTQNYCIYHQHVPHPLRLHAFILENRNSAFIGVVYLMIDWTQAELCLQLATQCIHASRILTICFSQFQNATSHFALSEATKNNS